MKEMSNREIYELEQQQKGAHQAIYGDGGGPNNGGFDWFSKLTVIGIIFCVIGIGIQRLSKPRPVKPIRITDPITDKDELGQTGQDSELSNSTSSSDISPMKPKSFRERETARSTPSMSRSSTRQTQPKLKKNEPPQFNSTGQLDSFPRSMSIDCLQTNQDGTRLYAGVNEMVIEYDLNTGERLREFIGHEGEITSLSVFDQSEKLITGSNDKTAIIWDLETGQRLHRLSENNTVDAVAGSLDGKLVATAALFKNPQVWSAETGAPLRQTKIESWPKNSNINALTFDNSGKFLIGGGTSYNSHIWNVSNGRQKGLIQAHKNQRVLDLAISPDGDSLLMLDAAGVKIFDTRRSQEQLSIEFKTPKRMQVLFTDGGRRFVAFDSVYDLKDGNLLSRAELPRSCRTVTATPDGSRFIYATSRSIEVIEGQ